MSEPWASIYLAAHEARLKLRKDDEMASHISRATYTELRRRELAAANMGAAMDGDRARPCFGLFDPIPIRFDEAVPLGTIIFRNQDGKEVGRIVNPGEPET